MEEKGSDSKLPLIRPPASTGGTATAAQTIGNIIVSIVGTGILGLPYSFRVAGWLAGSLGVIVAGISTYYCMLLLVRCKRKIVSDQELEGTATALSYGDLGYKCLGTAGRYATETLIFVSQCGGCVAYLAFIGQNLASVFKVHNFTSASYVFMLVPIEIALSWIRSLSSLSLFSIFADLCNVLAMAIVVKEDIQQVIRGDFSFSNRDAITSNIGGIPFAAGMAVFCFEGFGMTLSLEASMKERNKFPKILAEAFAGIMFAYVLFGIFGYIAYGDQTQDIITLNLPRKWSSTAVQVGLCLALVFTFPMMVHPMNAIIEGKLKKFGWFQKLQYNAEDDSSMTTLGNLVIYFIRGVLVVALAVLASFVPGFGVFASLVGSSVCALLSFVLPISFHLSLFGESMSGWQKALDILILSCGLAFALYGTYNTIFGV